MSKSLFPKLVTHIIFIPQFLERLPAHVNIFQFSEWYNWTVSIFFYMWFEKSGINSNFSALDIALFATRTVKPFHVTPQEA
jgi:hypothetical protein